MNRRAMVTGFGQQVELIDLPVAEEDLAHVPFHAFFDDAIATPQPVENFQRTLGPADGARADTDRVVFVEHEHVDAALGEIDGRAKTDRTGAGDNHRPMMRRPAAVDGRRTIDRMRVCLHRVFTGIAARSGCGNQ